MSTITLAAPDRAVHQRRVAALLEDIERRRQHVYFLRAGGARVAGLRDLKAELHALKDELAAAISRVDLTRGA